MLKTGWRFRPVTALWVLVGTALLGHSPLASVTAASQAEYARLFSRVAGPELSADANTLYGAKRPLVFVADPNPPAQHRAPRSDPFDSDLSLLWSVGADWGDAQPESPAAAVLPPATFSIHYLTAGESDIFDQPCSAFPESARAAFDTAATIWSNILRSGVPISIRACWADFGSDIFLGYSGGGSLHRNFSSAPRANTWYAASLANSLAGSDLDPTNEDMHLTFNLGFSWYYGTDGSPPSDRYDLVSVVLHEIGHGLNFSGSMSYSGGFGFWGFQGSPEIYDVFMKDGADIDLISYSSGTLDLGSKLVSDDIWFHGPNTMTANGGGPVKIYAPAIWQAASSYSHLDYDTFNDTDNQLMVYAISAGESIQDPGPVTRGLLRDLGWSITAGSNLDFAVTDITLNPVRSPPSSLRSASPRGKDRDDLSAIEQWMGIEAAAPVDGGGFSARIRVTNQGTVAGDAGYLAVWTDRPLTVTCGATGVQSKPVGRLAPGASLDLYFTGLQEGSAGSKTFRAFVDSGCNTAESNEGNNQLTLGYTVADIFPKPDLVITEISLSPSTPVGQQAFSARVTVQNQGPVASGANWLRVWPHEPNSLGCGALSSRAMWVENLAPAESRSYYFMGLPAGAQGAKTFRAFVDSGCDTTESNEANNQLTQGYSVSAAGPPPSS